jgi:hypothetical protein
MNIGSVSATQTHFLFNVKRRFKITHLHLSNDAVLAAHGSNYVVIEIKRGSTVLGDWSTATGGDGGLPAADVVQIAIDSANDTVPANSTITCVVTINGSAALTRSRVIVEGYYT